MKKLSFTLLFISLLVLFFCPSVIGQKKYNFDKLSKRVRSIERKNSIMWGNWSKNTFYNMRKHLELPANFINFQNDIIYLFNCSSLEIAPIETIWSASNPQAISFIWRRKGIEILDYPRIDTLMRIRYKNWEYTKQKIKSLEQTKQKELQGTASAAIADQVIRIIFKDGIPYFDSYIHNPLVDYFWDD